MAFALTQLFVAGAIVTDTAFRVSGRDSGRVATPSTDARHHEW
ncbi:MAG TPA: hypothetical protein VJ124_14695 [Pyrinomonadaceae bacterium]|nr:hypothetical protein [Pyrinomonadaceae bacterium]